MALAKKGTRIIRVDEIAYRWVVQPFEGIVLAKSKMEWKT
jgi:hypothetical protein